MQPNLHAAFNQGTENSDKTGLCILARELIVEFGGNNRIRNIKLSLYSTHNFFNTSNA